jgi:zinc protease
MLTEGTQKRTSQEISEEIEFVGGSIGASADDDYTVISLSVLKKDIGAGFDILSDILVNPSFPENELKNIKRLIKGGLRQKEEDPGYVAGRNFGEAVYGDHPYGRPVAGTIESIDGVKRDDLVRFHRSYYRPNNSVLSVVGDIGYSELSTLIKKYLATWNRGDITERKTYSVKEMVAPVIVKIDRELAQASIVLGHIGVKRADPDYYSISVMNYILGGGGFSSRLMTKIRDEMGLAYDVRSLFIPLKQKGVFQVSVQTKNESANTAIREILSQMKRIRDEDVSDGELADAKSYMTGSFPRRLDTMAKISRLLALIEFYELGLDYDKKYLDYINKVTVDDVRRVANKYLHPDRYVLVIVADQGKVK